MIDNQGEQKTRNQQEFTAERIMIVVVSGLKLHVHQIHGGPRCGQKENLHHRVVEADVGGEQIEIA